MIHAIHSLILLLVLVVPMHAATRVALVTVESSPEIEQSLLLAEAELGNDAAVQLLDRKHISQVLSEQKLALSGLADPEQAIKVGKLLNVEVFAVVEIEPDKKKTLGLVAFETRSGIRIWDAPFTTEGIEATVAEVVAGVKGAVAKYRAKAGEAHTLGLLTVRNADLPRSEDSTVQAVGRLLERRLVQSPGVALVERDRLRAFIEERNLPGKDPLPPLLASLRLIELEISRDKEHGLSAVARITNSEAGEIAIARSSGADPVSLVAGLLPEVLKSLNLKAAGESPDRAIEADRFYRESWHRWRHRDYARAALEAEAAHALDPDNTARLKWLIDRLAEAAIELIDPGQQTYAGPPRASVDPRKLEQSLDLARHGLNLFGLYYKRVMRNPDWFRDQNSLSVMWYHTYLAKVTAFDDKTTPRSKQLVAEFVNEYRDIQFGTYGKGLSDAAKEGRGFREYTSWVASGALLDIFHRFPATRDDWSLDAADVLVRWAEIADSQHPAQDKQLMRSSDYVLMTVRWSSRVPKVRSETDLQRLREAYTFLEARNDPVLNLHGKLLTLLLDREVGKLTPEQARPRVTDLVAKVEPLAIAPDGPTQDHETRRRWIDLLLRANELLPPEERSAANQTFLAALEAHGLYSPFVFYEVAVHSKFQKKDEELLALLASGISQLDRKPAGLTDAELRSELVKLKEWHRTLAESMGKSAGAVTPWESLKTVIDVHATESGVRSIVRPVVAGRTVYALGMRWDLPAAQVAFTLLQLDLDGAGAEQRGTFTLDNLPPAKFGDRTSLADGHINQLTVIERSTTEGSYFVRSACLSGDNYYAATLGRGMLVFPLKGGPPLRIDESKGLPSDFVQYLLPHEGRIYGWLGQPGKAAYLIRMETDGTGIEVIASSRRTIRKTPLDNVSPILCDFMHVDAPRNRIVFRLTNFNSDDVMGFWELSLSDDSLKQLRRTHLVLSGYPPRVVPGDKILVKDGYLAQLFDLKTNELRTLVKGEGQYPGSFLPIALFGDKLWTGYPFGNIDVKTRRTELFPNLRAQGKTFQPGIVFAHVSEREHLLGDTEGLWLIRLK